MSENGRQRLSSWKEIAAYVGRDVRTVLRWEKERGLPVHRPPGETGRVIFAYTDELDAWLLAGSERVVPVDVLDAAPPRASYRVVVPIALAGTLIAVLVPWYWLRGSPTEIAEVQLTSMQIRARAADGRTLWIYPFPRPVEGDSHQELVVDLNGDGHRDVIASVIEMENGGTANGGTLLALDHRGRKLWQQSVADSLAFGAGTYSAPWQPDALNVYRSGGEPYIAWAVHHQTWWPSMLAVFNSRGERTGTFVNSGWVRDSTVTQDGRYLLAAGVNNARNGAAFAILDARHPNGSSPEDPGSPYQCTNCAPGVPIRYYVVPWSDIIDPTVLDGRRGQFVAHPDGSIQLRAVQRWNGEMFVELTPSFEIKARSVSDGFWDWHRKLEAEGVLHHTRETCPFRDGPPIFEWMPEHGWREVPR